jgi:hypothetical protein
MDRRTMLTGTAVLAMGAGPFSTLATPTPRKAVNLIPQKPGRVSSYWCTWGRQNYGLFKSLATVVPETYTGNRATEAIENQLNEANLFGKSGWATRVLPQIRSDLFVLVDEGWQAGGYATFDLDESKFPSFRGTKTQKVSQLNRRIVDLGWHGTGLWCRSTPGGEADRQLFEVMRDGGIGYCKVDQGDAGLNFIKLRDAIGADIQFEHVVIDGPLNGDWQNEGRFRVDEYIPFWNDNPGCTSRRTMLRNTDVFRVYDTTSILGLPTTLDRLGQYLKAAIAAPGGKALINVEDEVYVAAVMGCTMGIMRHPDAQGRADGAEDWAHNGPRNAKRRMDEVVRALRWQRIAGPYPASEGYVQLDSEILDDEWRFSGSQMWLPAAINKFVRQGAPARLSRNIELPTVSASGTKPFVFANRSPNGAVAIGCQERTQVEKAWFMPPAKVELAIGDANGPIGIFGTFEELTLIAANPIGDGPILAQDLAGEKARDIRKLMRVEGNRASLSRAVIDAIGLQAASPGDLSSPGLVLRLPSASAGSSVSR